MIDDEDLETSVLNFAGASFGFERSVQVGRNDLLLFSRRETESEAKFRPRIVRRWVVVPRTWVFLARDDDILVLGKDGQRPHRPGGLTIQSADGTRPPPSFTEQGIEFQTVKFPGDLEVYVVAGQRADLLSQAGLAALGLPAPSGA